MNDRLAHISIRDTTADDIVALRTMHGQSWRDTYPNEAAGVSHEWVEARTKAWLEPEGIERSKEHFKSILGSPDHYHKIAFDGENVVGMVHMSNVEGKQYLDALYVDKRYHGSGLAQQLIEGALAWCDRTRPIDLEVATYNERAKAFYRKYGFEEIPGTETQFADVIPVITMERKAHG